MNISTSAASATNNKCAAESARAPSVDAGAGASASSVGASPGTSAALKKPLGSPLKESVTEKEESGGGKAEKAEGNTEEERGIEEEDGRQEEKAAQEEEADEKRSGTRDDSEGQQSPTNKNSIVEPSRFVSGFCFACGRESEELVELPCQHGSCCVPCLRSYCVAEARKNRLIRCIVRRNKCTYRCTSTFLRFYQLLDPSGGDEDSSLVCGEVTTPMKSSSCVVAAVEGDADKNTNAALVVVADGSTSGTATTTSAAQEVPYGTNAPMRACLSTDSAKSEEFQSRQSESGGASAEECENLLAAGPALYDRYEEIECRDVISRRIAEGLSHRCRCGKVYDRDGGFCFTGHCDSCGRSFCFFCGKVLYRFSILCFIVMNTSIYV